MSRLLRLALLGTLICAAPSAFAACPYYDPACSAVPLKDYQRHHRPYENPYSNRSSTNPYATNTPRIVDDEGNYYGRLSTNRYAPDSTGNPYGQYGSRYSPDSINNPYGAGNPYSSTPLYVVPSW